MMWFSFYLKDFSEAISRELQLLPVVVGFHYIVHVVARFSLPVDHLHALPPVCES